MENRKFGKLINDYLAYAQTTIIYNDTIISNPTDEQYKECGYKEVKDDKKIGDVITYTEDDTTITVNHSISLNNAKQHMIGIISDYDIFFGSDFVQYHNDVYNYRCYGHLIRPVLNQEK